MLRFLALLGILSALLTGPVLAAPAKPRVLYLSQSVGWRHAPVIRPEGGLSPSEIALADLARTSGAFTLETTQDAREITAERLRGVDVLMFYTTGALPITPGNWQAIQDWVASGKGGFVGLHSAADTGWPYDGPGQSFTRFVGGKFAGHPWTEGTPITVASVAPHATTAAWPPRFAFAEEIYQYAEFDPASTRVLQTLDFTGTPLKRPYLVPVSWVKAVGQGRLVFTNLGHAPTTFQEPRFQAQVVSMVRWAAGHGRSDAAPNPDQQAFWAIRSLLAYDGRPALEIEARIRRLARTDRRWRNAMADRIAALQPLYPAKPDGDRARFEAVYRPLLSEVLARSSR